MTLILWEQNSQILILKFEKRIQIIRRKN
jgi:hypothetical protein